MGGLTALAVVLVGLHAGGVKAQPVVDHRARWVFGAATGSAAWPDPSSSPRRSEPSLSFLVWSLFGALFVGGLLTERSVRETDRLRATEPHSDQGGAGSDRADRNPPASVHCGVHGLVRPARTRLGRLHPHRPGRVRAGRRRFDARTDRHLDHPALRRAARHLGTAAGYLVRRVDSEGPAMSRRRRRRANQRSGFTTWRDAVPSRKHRPRTRRRKKLADGSAKGDQGNRASRRDTTPGGSPARQVGYPGSVSGRGASSGSSWRDHRGRRPGSAVSEIVLPMTFAAVLAVIFKPLVGFLERHGVKPTLAAGLVVLGLLAVMTGVVVATVQGVTEQTDQIGASVDAAMDQRGRPLECRPGVAGDGSGGNRGERPRRSPAASSELVEGVGTLVGVASGLILGALIMYYLLKDGTRLRRSRSSHRFDPTATGRDRRLHRRRLPDPPRLRARAAPSCPPSWRSSSASPACCSACRSCSPSWWSTSSAATSPTSAPSSVAGWP